MSETWYLAWPVFNEIKPIQVERSTASYVWIGKARHARESYQSYHRSWEDAHAYLLQKAEGDVLHARRALEKAQGKLGNVKGMKRPIEAASNAS